VKAIRVIGGGLAGSEATWQLVQQGLSVELWEMRPHKNTPAHHTPLLAELVCSNSLRSDNLGNAVGLLKEEMRRLGSLIMACADEHRVPAGNALAVDRTAFANCVTRKIEGHPLVTINRAEALGLDTSELGIIATGPLTSPAMADFLAEKIGGKHLYFYDAAAPIVTADSLNYNKVFRASRYGKGEADYLNCPMDREQYEAFYRELIGGDKYKPHDFEKEIYFEGCMPIEEMARRGPQTLLYGPMKPVGLTDPRTGRRPYAVVQLRQDNREGTLYNLVGFQTQLKWPEQQRIFQLIPGLENAEFVRFGVMHRNTYINSPTLLHPTLQTRDYPNLLLAGQLIGVEGYVESAAMGLLAGLNAARLAVGKEPLVFPTTSAMGALANYVTTAMPDSFQPMNITFGLMPPLHNGPRGKRERHLVMAERALADLARFCRDSKVTWDGGDKGGV